jgi:hypothetical protein
MFSEGVLLVMVLYIFILIALCIWRAYDLGELIFTHQEIHSTYTV